MARMRITLDATRARRQIREIEDALVDSAVRYGESISGMAADDAPIKTGLLRGSFTVRVTRMGPRTNIRIENLLPYAKAQEQRTDYAHPRGGDAKFLYRSLRWHAPKFAEFQRDAMRLKIRQMGGS